MSLSLKQINNLFYDIRDGKSALLLGQEYFKVDPYYSSVLKQLDIKNETPSLNSLSIIYVMDFIVEDDEQPGADTPEETTEMQEIPVEIEQNLRIRKNRM